MDKKLDKQNLVGSDDKKVEDLKSNKNTNENTDEKTNNTHNSGIDKKREALLSIESQDEREERLFGDVMPHFDKEELFVNKNKAGESKGLSENIEDNLKQNQDNKVINTELDDIQVSDDNIKNTTNLKYIMQTVSIFMSLCGIYLLFFAKPSITTLVGGIITLVLGSGVILFLKNKIKK